MLYRALSQLVSPVTFIAPGCPSVLALLGFTCLDLSTEYIRHTWVAHTSCPGDNGKRVHFSFCLDGLSDILIIPNASGTEELFQQAGDLPMYHHSRTGPGLTVRHVNKACESCVARDEA